MYAIFPAQNTLKISCNHNQYSIASVKSWGSVHRPFFAQALPWRWPQQPTSYDRCLRPSPPPPHSCSMLRQEHESSASIGICITMVSEGIIFLVKPQASIRRQDSVGWSPSDARHGRAVKAQPATTGKEVERSQTMENKRLMPRPCSARPEERACSRNIAQLKGGPCEEEILKNYIQMTYVVN